MNKYIRTYTWVIIISGCMGLILSYLVEKSFYWLIAFYFLVFLKILLSNNRNEESILIDSDDMVSPKKGIGFVLINCIILLKY